MQNLLVMAFKILAIKLLNLNTVTAGKLQRQKVFSVFSKKLHHRYLTGF